MGKEFIQFGGEAEMKSLYIIYVTEESFIQTWADTVKEDDFGVSFFYENKETARFKVWSYWFIKENAK